MRHRVIASVLGVIALVGLAFAGILTPSASAATTLPPIPAGLPNYFGFGLSNNDSSWMTGSGVAWNYRYAYLSGGANTGDGWASWNSPAGQFATNYIADSRAANTIPGFVYYQILQSAPNYDEYSNLNNTGTMRSYYNDFKLLMQKSAGSSPVVVIIEPDLTGVMQQDPSNTHDDASLQPSSVASSGQPDVAAYPNSFRGFYQALAHLRDLYAPNVLLGLDLSLWGAGDDLTLALRDDPSFDWQSHAARTATYLNSLGPGFQFLAFSPLDRDAAYYQSAYASNRWWDDNNVTQPTFNTMLSWLGSLITQTNKRALLWQVPNGNRLYRSENNTDGHYQDNRAEYFLNPTSGRSHISQWAAAGVLGIMFGAGAGAQSHYFDSAGDGVTNPAPINGNTAVAQYADDDGGYLRLQTAAYYQQGPITLPGGAAQPTPTPAPPTATPQPGTPTPVPPSPTAVSCNGFTDVQPSDYFYSAVGYLAARGIIAGYNNCTFRPYNNTTRAQLSKMVVLAESFASDTTGGPHFVDVPADSAFYSYIETAYNRNLISGYRCGGGNEPCPGLYFRPGSNVTRGQFAKIIVNAQGWTLSTPGTPSFRDVSSSSAFFPFVETAVAHGLMSGYTCGGSNEPCPGLYFRSGNSSTRGQLAKSIYNAITGP